MIAIMRFREVLNCSPTDVSEEPRTAVIRQTIAGTAARMLAAVVKN